MLMSTTCRKQIKEKKRKLLNSCFVEKIILVRMAAKQEKRSKKIMVSERELLKGLAKREPSWLAKDSKAAVDSETSRKNSVDLFSVAAHKSLSFSEQTEERRKIVAARLSGMGHRSAKAGDSGATRENSVDLFSVTAHKSLSFSEQTNEETRKIVAARLSGMGHRSAKAGGSGAKRENSVDLFSVTAHKSLSFSEQTNEETRKIVAARLSGMGRTSAKAGGSGATRKNSVDLFSVTAHKSLSFSGQTKEESREVVAARLSGMGSRIASFREQSKHAKARENSLDLFSVTAHKSLSFSGQTKEESREVVAARLSGMGSRIASFREQSKHAKARENSLDLFSVTAHKNLSFGSGGVSWPRSGGGERRKSAGR